MTTETEIVTLETLFVVFNEDGNVTADSDRDTAISRMNDDYGGAELRVIEVTLKVPRPKDYLASITLPEVAPITVEAETTS